MSDQTLVAVTLHRQVEGENGSHYSESYAENRRVVTLVDKKGNHVDTFYMAESKQQPKKISLDLRVFELADEEMYIYQETK